MHTLLLLAAKYLWPVVVLVAFVFWLKLPREAKIRMVVFGIIAAAVTLLLVKTGEALYYSPRPFVAHDVTPLYPHGPDNGFPSNHTVFTALIAFIIFSASKRVGAFLLVLSVLIGISRVIGNIHSPIDIAGGLAFALIGFGIATLLTPYVFKRLKTLRTHST